MQQTPVLPAPVGASPSLPGSTPSASSAATTAFGIEFSTALLRAIALPQPITNGASGLLAGVVTESTPALPGLPSLLAELATSATSTTPEASDETAFFPLLGNLLPNPDDSGSQIPVTDFVIPEFSGVIASEETTSQPEVSEFELPFDELLAALSSFSAAPPATIDPVNPVTEENEDVPTDVSALLAELKTAGAPVQMATIQAPVTNVPARSREIMPSGRTSTSTTATALTGGMPGDPAKFGSGASLEQEGFSSRKSGTMPVSFLPKEARLEVPRAVLGRFQSARNRDVDLPPPNLSVLTQSELSAEAVSTEDRNATVLARIDRVEFVNRMTQALERARLESPKSIELELNPPSLGKLRIEVTNVDGQLTARIQTESAAARSLLVDHMSVLDRHLGDHGIQMQKVQVELAPAPTTEYSGSNGFNGQQNPQHSQPQNQSQNSSSAWQWQQRNEEGDRGPPISVSELLALAPGMDRLI